jgi:hypothetical protein
MLNTSNVARPMPVNSTASATESYSSQVSTLAALLHHKPAALLIAQIELPHGGSFGGLTARRLHVPEDLSALADERRAPGTGSCGAGVTVG